MAAPDMDVIKEIPGYKVILKAVLKSQIQQLVEQLASHTDEETVVLTASISDGTLSHLGSASGKSFLEDHEEMKSQFLGFCLKRHHKKSQEQTFKQLEMQSPGLQDPSSMGYAPHLPPGNQMGTTRMGIGTENRQRGLRHEPYRRSRGQGHRQHSNRRPPAPNDNLTNSSMPLPISETPERSSIKTEPESVENESSNQSFGEIGADSSVHHSSHPQQANTSTTDSMDIPTGDSNSTPLTDGQSMHLDLSGLVPNTDQASEQNSSALSDTSVSVKQESGVDSDLDLQITGTEPGRSTVPRDNWGANVSMSDISMDMNYDPSGATGSSHDMQAGQHGYSYTDEEMMTKDRNTYADPDGKTVMYSTYKCKLCSKSFRNRGCVRRHFVCHTGAKEFRCEICLALFSRKDHMKRHMRSVHKEFFTPLTMNESW